VAVLGATGAVGREMWRLLEGAGFPISRIIAYASPRTAGTSLEFRGRPVPVEALTEETFRPVHMVLASAGAAASRLWAPRFADAGAVVVDNSSAFREDRPLIVPEINGHQLDGRVPIIANPNCSTIQMVVALAPLHRAWTLRSVRVATYQSVSGAGSRAMAELTRSTREALEGNPGAPEMFPRVIAFNVIPEIGEFTPEGETGEEVKMRRETRRILDLPELPLSATCVRVPVLRGHSEAVWAGFESTPDPAEARRRMREAGVLVVDDPDRPGYPVPRDAAGRPEVFVGRVRRDPTDSRGLCLWVVSDNLLKGAATNAFQIAEMLVERGLLAAPSPS
jgi:aspartate-semialdehyde dehydrogenase